MELKELTDRILELFGVDNPDNLGSALMESVSNTDKHKAFCDLVGGDLSVDWMQMIYQYHLADRKEKKQDYTPKSVAQLMGALIGDTDKVVDMCAGSGALIIQKWTQNPNIEVTALEIDENVIPFLLFNMALRNINCRVIQGDVLTGEDVINTWQVTKGERFGRITNIKSTV
ncbi:MAG: N-6 DNA methylase [Oscillospiraceae bacterium]|nr:N-6 DNA methylase [Oscillospiraceae bacterium]